MQTRIQNHLVDLRKGRGIAAADLARYVGVTRQTIYAIEAGTYVPNTEVSLRLARVLEVSVEEIFSLCPSTTEPSSEHVTAELLTNAAPAIGQPVKVCQAGSRWIGIPAGASPYYLPEADGIVSRHNRATKQTDIAIFSKEEASSKKLILAGCDPAANLLTSTVTRMSGVEIVSAAASSARALTWLKEGKVHIAGSHLEEPATGEFNLPFVKREFPKGGFTIVTLAHWEQGLVVAKGNPQSIRAICSLARKNIRFVNRERGSGSRTLFDKLLRESGIPSTDIHGYETEAVGHLAAAYRVFIEESDCCLATRSAAKIFGLDFIPLRQERYDLVMRKQALQAPAMQSFLDVLQRAALRRKLESLAGYDTAQTGVHLA